MDADSAFENRVNPTAAEIRRWAFSAEAMHPMQDWDLIVAHPDLATTLIALAADPDCPRRRFFLGCLYLIAGDAVRSHYLTLSVDGLRTLTDEADGHADPWLRSWAARTRALIEAPGTFDYDAWCCHGLAREPVDDA
jgi:hypothetical protein